MEKRLSNPQRDEWVKMMLHTKLSHRDRRSPRVTTCLPPPRTLMRRGRDADRWVGVRRNPGLRICAADGLDPPGPPLIRRQKCSIMILLLRRLLFIIIIMHLIFLSTVRKVKKPPAHP